MTHAVPPLEPFAELAPLSEAAPCGPSLEYDAEYAVLLARMSPRGEAQYGEFVGLPEAPNWAEIERDCRRLLLRTRDINLLVWLCRARARLAQAEGLAQALALLSAVLARWPEAVHPQCTLDGERDPAVRANALAALADPDGLLGDVRGIVVAADAAGHLTVREVERAHARPRPADALDPEAVARQLARLRLAATQTLDSPVHLLATAARIVGVISAWGATHLGPDAPSLQALADLLKPFEDIESAATPAPAPAAAASVQVREGPGHSGAAAFAARDEVLQDIRRAREWFESHEPSSPVAVLLRQAERMVGRRFAQVVEAIPLDLLRKWDCAEERIGG